MVTRSTQRKGDIALSKFIAYFTEQGYDVLLPLTESAAYDLVVDIENILWRVQVKYSSTIEIDLRSIHSNSQGYVVKKMKNNTYDMIAVYHPEQGLFIKKECLTGRRSIRLSQLDNVSKKI